jgi:hypothetical protein
MNKKQFAINQAVAAANTAAAKEIVAKFDEAFTEIDTNAPEFSMVCDAWNAAHDMVTALEAAEQMVVQDFNFARIVKAGKYESYLLAANNVD